MASVARGPNGGFEEGHRSAPVRARSAAGVEQLAAVKEGFLGLSWDVRIGSDVVEGHVYECLFHACCGFSVCM